MAHPLLDQAECAWDGKSDGFFRLALDKLVKLHCDVAICEARLERGLSKRQRLEVDAGLEGGFALVLGGAARSWRLEAEARGDWVLWSATTSEYDCHRLGAPSARLPRWMTPDMKEACDEAARGVVALWRKDIERPAWARLADALARRVGVTSIGEVELSMPAGELDRLVRGSPFLRAHAGLAVQPEPKDVRDDGRAHR